MWRNRSGMLAFACAAAGGLALLVARPAPSHAADESEEAEEATPAVEAPTEPQAAPGTFEAAARAAAPMSDLATLLTPFVETCANETRELDRLRCQIARGYLRKVIPRRSFWTVVDDPAALAVSEFDGSIKGYHVTVAGCLACTNPITVGHPKEKRIVTVKAPEKAAATLAAAVQLNRSSVGFDNLPEAKRWLEQGRPDLRTQFVFQPANVEWSFGAQRGYALTLVAMRVFNRCTGEVLISRPPSAGAADVPGMDEGCSRRRSGDDPSEANRSDPAVPEGLSKNAITQAMNEIRPRVFACFQKYKVPGLAQFDFVVAGNGTVQGVGLTGAFFGTPTGVCVLEAAQAAHFPPFARPRQQFVYPFFLRQ